MSVELLVNFGEYEDTFTTTQSFEIFEKEYYISEPRIIQVKLTNNWGSTDDVTIMIAKVYLESI